MGYPLGSIIYLGYIKGLLHMYIRCKAKILKIFFFFTKHLLQNG